MKITYLGQAGLLFEHNGFKIMMIKLKLGNMDIDFLLFFDGTYK